MDRDITGSESIHNMKVIQECVGLWSKDTPKIRVWSIQLRNMSDTH